MRNIFVIDNKDTLKEKIKKFFAEEKEIRVKKILSKDYEKVFKNIPDIIIINETSIEENVLDLCKNIRNNEDNLITPIVVVSANNDKKHIIEILKNQVDLFIESPVNDKILFYSIKNLLRLLNSNRTVSPLTGLPGNVQIQAEIKKRLMSGRDFEMLYLDLDNFKAYNDTYGFSNGDEMIKFTARVISKNVFKGSENNFVGHIGGDDFVAITEDVNFEKICQNIIAEFDSEVLDYYNKEDRERGYIEVENRKGIMEQFALTSISIGAVEANNKRFKNVLEVGEAGAVVKHLAKTIFGSTYVIDRRKNREKRLDKPRKKIR